MPWKKQGLGHQELENVIRFPDQQTGRREGAIRKSERLGGLINYAYRVA
jgi:hypothetical protein